MLTLEELKKKRDLVNDIDWSMTPEKAIDMYLEWGAGWTRGNDFVSFSGQESYYFVIYDWESPQVTLLRRSMEEVEEVAKVQVPEELFKQACIEDGKRPGVGVHPLNKDLQQWLCERIGACPIH